MSLPETIRVKLSSEAADTISITPVVLRDIPMRELIEHMLGVTGKDTPRIHELLLRGTLVSGASRFRWAGWDSDRAAIGEMLATFPDPDPLRPFSASRCVRASLRGPGRRIEIPREVGQRKPLFRRSSFWDTLMDVVVQSETRYLDYSYRERADCYAASLSLDGLEKLRARAGLVKYTTLQQQIRQSHLETVDLWVTR
ncbi:MAG TPA: hypothetical protein VL285_01850 [Bryobacteraceae bacterium]|jgi:hypothetical protein|nr:hypothetical protein [Bryobacteraceae bacterium]